MRTRLLSIALACFAAVQGAWAGGADVLVVAGAPGAPQYVEELRAATAAWRKAAKNAEAYIQVIGEEGPGEADRKKLLETLGGLGKGGNEELWIVLLGHGTWDRREAKFNLRGDDITASDLAQALQGFERPLILVAGFSASGAFLKPLAAPGRMIVTATRNGSEENYARFGRYFSEAIADPEADVDRDGQVSLLEAWLTGAGRVKDFYEAEGRLATEHSLLDDTGDGLGTPPDWFEGTVAVKRAKEGAIPDGQRAHQIHLVKSAEERALSADIRRQRDALEMELSALREKKPALPELEYLAQLEAILLRLADLYESS